MVDFTPEERTEEIIEILKKENIVPVCNETILKCVQEAQSENEKEITETKTTFEVIVAAGKKKRGDKNGNYTIKSAQELESSKGKIIDILFRHTKTEMNMQRFSLTFNDTDKKQYIIFPRRMIALRQGRQKYLIERLHERKSGRRWRILCNF